MTYGLASLKQVKRVLSLGLILALLAPSVHAHKGGGRGGNGNGGRDGRGDHGGGRDGRNDRDGGSGRENNSNYGGGSNLGNNNKPATTPTSNSNDDSVQNMPGKPKPQEPDYEDQKYLPIYKPAQSTYGQSYPSAQAAASLAQAEYFANLAKYYKAASRKTLALGIVTTAEGLGKILDGGIKKGDGDTLVASGLKSLEAGEELRKTEEETLSKIEETAEPKEVDAELIADPLAEEVITDLAAKTGYSKAEVIEKILGSKGSLDALAEDFESAISRKSEIDLAKSVSPEDLEAILADTKSGALRKKINFASLREMLTTSATVAKGAGPADWKKQWGHASAASGPWAVVAADPASAKKLASSRAPASQPEFLNLGENLPSFDLEQGELEEANELSLFEKVHRKYAEIAPSMRRKK